jgi:NADPH:quinone reductase
LRLEDPQRRWLPGKDIANTVVHAAAHGTGPGVGTRAVGHPPAQGWAERDAVATRHLATLPDRVEANTADARPLADLTALRLLCAAGPTAGASGGVGHYLTELAAGTSVQVTAVSASTEHGPRLLDLRAADVVTDAEQPEGPYDVLLESVGGASLPTALPASPPRVCSSGSGRQADLRARRIRGNAVLVTS